jgi:hypothetical protein
MFVGLLLRNKLSFTPGTYLIGLALLNTLNFAPGAYFVHLALLNKLNITSSTYFVDFALEMYQSSSLNLALWRLKHAGVTEC